MNYQAYLALKLAAIGDLEKPDGSTVLREALLSDSLMPEARLAYSEVIDHFKNYEGDDPVDLPLEIAKLSQVVMDKLRYC